jgi:hypothetical protein
MGVTAYSMTEVEDKVPLFTELPRRGVLGNPEVERT